MGPEHTRGPRLGQSDWCRSWQDDRESRGSDGLTQVHEGDKFTESSHKGMNSNQTELLIMKTPLGSTPSDRRGSTGLSTPFLKYGDVCGGRIAGRILILSLFIGSASPLPTPAEDAAPTPELISLFPLGASRGSTLRIQVRGKHLQGTYGVWFANPALRGQVRKIEEIPIEEKKSLRDEKKVVPGHRAFLEIPIDPSVEPGKYLLRLVSPRGVSNPLWFMVLDKTVSLELPGDRSTPGQAQLLHSPAVVHGRIGQQGEIDFYAIDLQAGQQLTLHALSNASSREFDAIQLTLHRAQGSWFDPDRPLRLAYSPDADLSHRCQRSGLYLIEVGSALGIGNPNVSYQLSVSASQEPVSFPKIQTILPPTPLARIQQPLQRPLRLDRLQRLLARTVSPTDTAPSPGKGGRDPSPGGSVASTLTERPALDCQTLAESEPNERAGQAPQVALPILLEGAIERAGDLDLFRFRVEPQTALAFELETPEAAPPEFNPHLSVLDENGEEILTNYFKKIAGDGDDWVKLVQAKTLYTLERGGEYQLQIRDITPRYGQLDFRYRVMIRPQIPHVGEFNVTPEVLHLSPGEAGKVTIVTWQEEGFQGEVAFQLQGLPAGVRALPGADVEPDKEPPLPEIHKERFVAKSQKTTIVLMADAEAPITRMPVQVRLSGRPVVRGKVGEALMVGEILVMVRTPPTPELPPGTEGPS